MLENNKINYEDDFENEYDDDFDYESFSYGFVRMSKPGSKINTTHKNKRPKGHQASIRKGGER